MRKILSYIIAILILSTPGFARAQHDIAIPSSAGLNAIDNQADHSPSNQWLDSHNSSSNELYTIIDSNTETIKNTDIKQKGDNIFISERGKNNDGVQDSPESEGLKNGSGFGSETDKNGSSADSNKESSKNSSDESASNKEQEQNNAAHNDTGDNKNNDNSGNDSDSESGKNREDSSEKQNAEDNRGSEEQPAPDDTTGDNRSKADKASNFIKKKRDYATSSEKAGSAATTPSSRTPARIPGKKKMLDHTAGDDSGGIDPNQTGNKPGIGTPPGKALDPGAFDKGNLTGKGLGQPDQTQVKD